MPVSLRIALTVLLNCAVSIVVAIALEWNIWHCLSFALAGTTLTHILGTWGGHEMINVLDLPLVGLLVIAVFVLFMWLGHFRPHGGLYHFRFLSFTMAVLAFAPYAVTTGVRLLSEKPQA